MKFIEYFVCSSRLGLHEMISSWPLHHLVLVLGLMALCFHVIRVFKSNISAFVIGNSHFNHDNMERGSNSIPQRQSAAVRTFLYPFNILYTVLQFKISWIMEVLLPDQNLGWVNLYHIQESNVKRLRIAYLPQNCFRICCILFIPS